MRQRIKQSFLRHYYYQQIPEKKDKSYSSRKHFEGNSDTTFIMEARGVISGTGKLRITHLDHHNGYACQTDPAFLPKGGIYFDESPVICAKGCISRFGRSYNVLHFIFSIVKNLRGFS